jgi:hypothetical protein
MMLNANSLRHPSTQWNIEAALWRALETGRETVCNRSGGEIVSIGYDRACVPSFAFYRNGMDVTGEFLKVLRA